MPVHFKDASIPDGAIDIQARIDTFNRKNDLGNVTDNQKVPKELVDKDKLLKDTDVEILEMIWKYIYIG